MHILMLNDDALPIGKGGAAVVVDRLRRQYAKHGHTVTLITTHQDALNTDPVRRWKDDAGETISIPAQVTAANMHKHCVSVTHVSTVLDSLLKEIRPDITHAHNVHSYLTYDALRVAALHTKKVFLTVHDTFLVSFARVGGDAYRKATLENKPYRMHWWNHLQAVGRKYYPLRNPKIRSIIRESNTKIVIYSRAMEKFLRDNGYTNLLSVHTGTIPSPTPSAADIESTKKQYGLHGQTILFGARISADKGVDALLTAAERVIASCPDVTFLIVGDQSRLEPHLKKASAEVQAHVRPTGWMTVSDIERAYHASEVITVPSIYLDNFPTINLEAMAAGKPVVGTCFGGTPEVVEDSVTGIIVNPLDTKAFSDALIDLLKHPEKRKQMGEAGQKRIQEHFAMERQVQEYLDLFTK